MENFTQREQSPLNSEQWATLENAAVEAARRHLVARRFLSLYGPLGVSAETVPSYRPASSVEVSKGAATLAGAPAQLTLPELRSDFSYDWRELERARAGLPFDVSPAVRAAVAAARAEDDLIFNGATELMHTGLANVAGRQILPLSSWAKTGAAFDDILKGVQALNTAGLARPYSVVMNTSRFARLQRVMEGVVLEIDQLKRLVDGGIFQTPALPDNVVLVLSPGAENMDLVIGQDLLPVFLETAELVHKFRLLETLALRVKEPTAVVALQA